MVRPCSFLSGVSLSYNDSVAVWQCGSVAVWQCGSVAVWQCGSVAVWQCGSVAVWQCGSVVDPAVSDPFKSTARPPDSMHLLCSYLRIPLSTGPPPTPNCTTYLLAPAYWLVQDSVVGRARLQFGGS
jgi:hypothetical protein